MAWRFFMGSRKSILYVTDGISPWVVGGMQAVSRRQISWLHDAGYNVIATATRADLPDQVDFANRLIPIRWPTRSQISKLDPWNYVRQLQAFSRRVSELIEELSPALIYSEGPLVDDYLRRSPSNRVPVLFHPHGLEMFQRTGNLVTDFRLRPMRALIRRHALRAEKTFSQGGSLDGILLDRIGLPLPKIAYLPNCKPAEFRFATAPRMPIKRRFLFLGRDEARKGLRSLTAALASLPGAHLDVVGPIRRARAGLPQITYHGSVQDRERIRAFFDEADFLVVPSLAEGMPTVILEAFSAGLPVIATDVGAIGALVKDGESGFLIPRNDRSALVNTLRRAMELQPLSYRQLSEGALKLAQSEFSPESVRRSFLKIVEDAIDLDVGQEAAQLRTSDGERLS